MTHRIRLLIACVAVVVLVVAAIEARQPPNPPQAPATGLILGQVVDADSGKGVPDVVITLGAPAPYAPPAAELVNLNVNGPSRPVGQTQQTLTNGDGRFLFKNLPKGRYAMTTSAVGYVPSAYGQARPDGPGGSIDLDDGQKLGDVKVRAWKYASISGRVIDDLGDPAVNVPVRAFRRTIAGGHMRFDARTFVSTDDRGMYRVANLVPGDYAVGCVSTHETWPIASMDVGPSGGPNATPAARSLSDSGAFLPLQSGFRVGEMFVPHTSTAREAFLPAPRADGHMQAYPTVFYPSAPLPSWGSLVSVTSGEARNGIDLSLKLVPAVRLSGTVTGPNGAGANLGITLVPAGFGDFQSETEANAARAASDASGHFIFLGVPADEYVLKIRMYPHPTTPPGRGGTEPPPPDEPSLWAALPVSVGEKDIADLAVVLRPGLRITGRIEFTGTKPQPTPDQIQRITIAPQSAEGRTSSPIAVPGRAAPDGAFRTQGYPRGRYIVAASSLPAGWSVKSIMWNGKDVSIEPLELADADVTGVVITCTDMTAAISGTVTGANGPDPAAEVIAFPADSTAWKDIGVPARRSRDERVAANGAFTLDNLPPGDYFVVALPGGSIGDWHDPKFLASLVPSATRVTLGDGAKIGVSLRTVQAAGRGAGPRSRQE